MKVLQLLPTSLHCGKHLKVSISPHCPNEVMVSSRNVQALCRDGCYTILYNSLYGDVIGNIAYNVSIRSAIHMLYA